MGLDSVELVMECEEEFGISIANDEAESVLIVGDLCDLIETKTAHLGIGPDTTYERVRIIVSEQLGVPMARVIRDARFVEDLGMD